MSAASTAPTGRGRRSRLSGTLAALAAAWLLCVPAAASAAELVQVTPAGCDRLTITGQGLKAKSALTLEVRNPYSGQTLSKTSVRTDAKGRFEHDARTSLQGLGSVQAELLDGGTSVARVTTEFNDDVKQRCFGDLPFTGGQAVPLLLAGAGLVGTGFLLRLSFAYRGRHQN